MIESSAVRLSDRSYLASVRREGLDHAARLGWRDTDRSNAAIVVTELATNLLKHAVDGVVSISSSATNAASRLLFLSVDHGPGMKDVEKCFADGYSTVGSAGSGLGAVRRLASAIDVFSYEKGTVLAAEINRPDRRLAPGALAVDGFSVPKEGETVNGDRWDYRRIGSALAVLVCDGLGHGLYAGEASSAAVAAFRALDWSGPKSAIESIDAALRPTRGAAAAIAFVEPAAGRVKYCGVGNIAASIVEGAKVRHLVSQNGIVGHSAARVTEFEYEWTAHSTLLMHSDGITARWRPEHWVGLWSRRPAVIAGTLYRDFARGNDDVVVVAVRQE